MNFGEQYVMYVTVYKCKENLVLHLTKGIWKLILKRKVILGDTEYYHLLYGRQKAGRIVSMSTERLAIFVHIYIMSSN